MITKRDYTEFTIHDHQKLPHLEASHPKLRDEWACFRCLPLLPNYNSRFYSQTIHAFNLFAKFRIWRRMIQIAIWWISLVAKLLYPYALVTFRFRSLNMGNNPFMLIASPCDHSTHRLFMTFPCKVSHLKGSQSGPRGPASCCLQAFCAKWSSPLATCDPIPREFLETALEKPT